MTTRGSVTLGIGAADMERLRALATALGIEHGRAPGAPSVSALLRALADAYAADPERVTTAVRGILKGSEERCTPSV